MQQFEWTDWICIGPALKAAFLFRPQKKKKKSNPPLMLPSWNVWLLIHLLAASIFIPFPTHLPSVMGLFLSLFCSRHFGRPDGVQQRRTALYHPGQESDKSSSGAGGESQSGGGHFRAAERQRIWNSRDQYVCLFDLGFVSSAQFLRSNNNNGNNWKCQLLN